MNQIIEGEFEVANPLPFNMQLRTSPFVGTIIARAIYDLMKPAGVRVDFLIDGERIHEHFIPPENIVLDRRGISAVGASNRIAFVNRHSHEGEISLEYWNASRGALLLFMRPGWTSRPGDDIALDPVLEYFLP